MIFIWKPDIRLASETVPSTSSAPFKTDQVQYCRARRLHWVEGGLVPLVASLVGPVYSGGSVPARQGRTFLGDWAREPSSRLLLVEGWLPNIVGAAVRHTVGVTEDGHIRGGRDSRSAHAPPAVGVADLVSRLAPSESRGHGAASLVGRAFRRHALARGRREAVEGCGGCAGGLEEEEDACPQVHSGACLCGAVMTWLLMAPGASACVSGTGVGSQPGLVRDRIVLVFRLVVPLT